MPANRFTKPIPKLIVASFLVSFVWLLPAAVHGQTNPARADWEKVVEAGKREGKVTVSIPASAELRKQLEENFKKRFGIEVEIFTARGSAGVRRMADEFKAGVRYFDLHIGGSA